MYTWIFVCGLIFAFYNSWGIGANDCANSFATSVGSKVLTLKQATIIAAIFEFSGAVLMGSHVTSAVRKKIVETEIFESNPGALMYGMLCADLSSAIWLTIATYFKLPVSTTHSIIGAIVGFSLAYNGSSAINWDKIYLVIASWVFSPVLSGIISSSVFYTLNRFVFQPEKSFEYTLRLLPVLVFVTFFINSLFIIYKGTPQLELDETPLYVAILSSILVGVVTGLISQFLYIPFIKKRINSPNTEEENNNNVGMEIQPTDSYREAVGNNDFIYDNELDLQENIKNSKKYLKELEDRKYLGEIDDLHSNSTDIKEETEKLCSWIQIITACFSSFAHGSNDIANSIAPLATIYHIYQYNSIAKKADVPIWLLAFGGVGIVLGLATWGYKIIDRIGRELTRISPSRGFIVELSAALTIIIASRSELPVSTTHCQIGSVVGIGLVGGMKNVKWSLFKKIIYSWLITLPVTGLLSAGLFSYGYYSPHELGQMVNNTV